MKKILFICDVLNATFGIAARGLVYQKYLEENNWQCDFVSCTQFVSTDKLPENIQVPYKTTEQIIQLAAESSVVYFIKILDLNLVWQIHNNTKAILLYDFYDTLWNKKKYEYNALLDLMDGLITEGTYLCDFLARYKKPVFEIKSACVYEDYREYKSKKNGVKIGWLGSSSTFRAIYTVKKELEHIGEKYPDTELRIVGAEGNDIQFKNIKVTYRPVYNHQEMIEELYGFDIGIFPPPADDFDYLVRGPHKGVRYMGAGKPAVFYNEGDCKLFVKDMKNAVLYGNPEEFEKKIMQLIEDEELRKKIGKAGYDAVYSIYSLESCQRSLLSVLNAMQYFYIPRFHL